MIITTVKFVIKMMQACYKANFYNASYVLTINLTVQLYCNEYICILQPKKYINVVFAERKSDPSCSLKEIMLNIDHIIWLHPYLPYCIVCTS